jgi:hypothetical protein
VFQHLSFGAVMAVLGCSTNVLSNVSQMPRGVESLPSANKTGFGRDAWCRMFVSGRASRRRSVREPLSPPIEGHISYRPMPRSSPNRARGFTRELTRCSYDPLTTPPSPRGRKSHPNGVTTGKDRVIFRLPVQQISGVISSLRMNR